MASTPVRPRLAALLADSDRLIIVVGGGGWLGQVTLALLDEALGEHMGGRVRVFGSREREMLLPSGRSLPCLPLDRMRDLPSAPCALLHYAFLGRERTFEMEASVFLDQNEAISEVVRGEIARLRPAAVFFPSSGAVYRADRTLETDFAANPYGAIKVREEQRFLALADLGARVTVPRVFNLAGPFINKLDRYVLSSILLDVQKGRPVVLRAARPVLRSYIHIGDLCDLALTLAMTDAAPPSEPFDTAGEEVVEVGELAQRCCLLLGRPQTAIERPPVDPSAPDRYVGEGAVMAALMESLGVGQRSLDRQILDTADYLAGLAPA